MNLPPGTTAASYLDALRRTSSRPMSESGHQMCAFQYFKLREKEDPSFRWIHSVPNGGHRTAAAAGKMKGEGQKPGVPDVFWDLQQGGYAGLRLELKTPRIAGVPGMSRTIQPGALSPDQREWIEWLTSQGYLAKVVYGCTHMIEVVEAYRAGELIRR